MVDQDDTAWTEVQEDSLSLLPSTQRESPELRWTDLSGTSRSARVNGRAVIGSASEAEITVEDPAVSRLHAEFEFHRDGLWVRDLGSRNGTFIESIRVDHARLDEGQHLRVGSTSLTINYDREPDPVELWPTEQFGLMLGRSVEMRELFVRMSRAAESDATVLISGETGTGKELVATAVHEASDRVDGPLVVVDCGAIHYGLLDAELFGHAKGAFTSAVADRAGAFEAAQRGTLFLDEVGELPLSVQPKLLRALESRTVTRVGETRRRAVDVRFLAATNRDLRAMVNEGVFREDLYFRLAVLHLMVPPLRSRADDIPLLLEHFLPANVKPPSAELLSELMRRPWPGNVRELRNFVDRALAFGTAEALETLASFSTRDGSMPEVPLDLPFKEVKERWNGYLEREYIKGLLKRHNSNVSAVAQVSGLNRTYIHRLIRKHGI